MKFEILFTTKSNQQMDDLESNNSKKGPLKAVNKVLAFMQADLRHPSLNTHKYNEFQGPNGEEIFETYAQNHTAGAYRIFWCYGPGKGKITIVAVTPHP